MAGMKRRALTAPTPPSPGVIAGAVVSVLLLLVLVGLLLFFLKRR